MASRRRRSFPSFWTSPSREPIRPRFFARSCVLYLAASTFWAIAAFKPAWQRVAVIWAIFFSFSLAIGRVISLVVDGPASRLLDLYLGLEVVGGLLGLAVLAYARKSQA